MLSANCNGVEVQFFGIIAGGGGGLSITLVPFSIFLQNGPLAGHTSGLVCVRPQ